MKLFGITRVRNEAAIIQDTLDHVGAFCDSIFVFDDASTDATPDICEAHPKVASVHRNPTWDQTPEGRNACEGYGRQVPYDEALNAGADYIYLFDADERAEFDHFEFTHDTHPLRLFAFYITPEDEPKGYEEREWMGPEYLDIPMVFKARERSFNGRVGRYQGLGGVCGYVKHYGKAISVQEWEDTCDYYTMPGFMGDRLEKRWAGRRGKAVHHGVSDFGGALIKWEDRGDESKIVRLTE